MGLVTITGTLDLSGYAATDFEVYFALSGELILADGAILSADIEMVAPDDAGVFEVDLESTEDASPNNRHYTATLWNKKSRRRTELGTFTLGPDPVDQTFQDVIGSQVEPIPSGTQRQGIVLAGAIPGSVFTFPEIPKPSSVQMFSGPDFRSDYSLSGLTATFGAPLLVEDERPKAWYTVL